jgi:hypothetical protein
MTPVNSRALRRILGRLLLSFGLNDKIDLGRLLAGVAAAGPCGRKARCRHQLQFSSSRIRAAASRV